MSATIGLVVLAGWHAGFLSFTNWQTSSKPMAYNTAITFTIVGLALVALGLGRRSAARLAGGLAALIAFGRLCQYLTGFPRTYETLVSRFTLPDQRVPAVPMAPNTVIALVWIAAGIWFLADGREFRGKAAAIALCGSVSAALGLNAFAGYLTGLNLYGWVGFQPMAIPTAGGLIVLGTGVLALHWRAGRGSVPDRRSWTAMLLLAAGAVTAVSFWQALRAVEEAHGQSALRFRSVLPEVVFAFILLMTLALCAAAYWAQTARLRSLLAERLRRVAEGVNSYNRSLLEASLDPLVTISPDGKITDANRATELVTGCARKELIGTDFSDYFTEPDKAREGYLQVFREGLVKDYELAIRRRDGQVTPVLYNASVYRDEGGAVTGVFAAARDITARVVTEKELRLSRERLALAQKAGHSGTFDWDIRNNVNLWTPEIEALYGIPAGSFGGRYENWEPLVYPDDLPQAKAALQESLKTGEFAAEWRIRRPSDGEVRWLAGRAKVLRDEQGRPERMIGINTDITERKRAEDALEQRARELARSNADLEQFAYVASHDLQEPLRMVANFSQLLADRYRDKLGAEGAEFIAYAVDGATRMQRLIEDLLTYSRVGTRSKAFAVVDCNEVLGQAVANLQIAVGETGALIRHDSLPAVLGDSSQLLQLFQNLVGNALKFRGPSPPRIEISAARQDPSWVFSVRDNGIGINPRYAERIFVIFQRLHNRGEYPGTGIGLAICKKIVERHQGKIWVESASGQGATFRFTIPVVQE